MKFTFPIRLCKKVDIVNKLLSRKWAPWAWVGMTITIGTSTAKINYQGSSIPNQSRYLNQGKAVSYNLLNESGPVVMSFFAAKPNELGPPAPASREMTYGFVKTGPL